MADYSGYQSIGGGWYSNESGTDQITADQYSQSMTELNAPRSGYEGLTAYQYGAGGQVTRGLRGASDNQYGRELGGENATWVMNPKTGKEEIAFQGPGGYYLLSDLMGKYGSGFSSMTNPTGAYGEGGDAIFNTDIWGARPSADSFTGKDGWGELLSILAMASVPWTAGAGLEAGAGVTGAGAAMPAAIVDSEALALMGGGATGGAGAMPAAIPETGSTLSQFGSASPGTTDFTRGSFDDYTGGDFSGIELGDLANPGPGSFNDFTGDFSGPSPTESFNDYTGNWGSAPYKEDANWLDQWRKRLMTGKGVRGVLGVGSGIYGLTQARQMQKLSQQAMERSDPFGPERAQYAAKLRELYADPSAVEKLPGYKAGLNAVERKMAAQGYNMSGNMAISLKDYGENAFNAEAKRLSDLAGAGMRPDTGAALSGRASATSQRGNSLASLAFGLSNFF